jgi:hypothetical protein
MGHLFANNNLKSNPGFDLSAFRAVVPFRDNHWVNSSRNVVELKVRAVISRLSHFGTMNLSVGRSG